MITADRLRQLLDYDPETGVFRWRVTNSNRARKGDIAGCYSDDYLLIRLDGRLYRANRLAWLYVTGEWPELFVDHINGRRDDNRWHNLRQATNAENGWNRGANRNSSSGTKGVYREGRSGKFVAEIITLGVKRRLGTFPTRQEAVAARLAAEAGARGEFGRAA